MDIMKLGLNDWVTCPFDPVHRLKYSKFHNHFVKCRAQHPEDQRKPCPYNYSELIEPKDWENHLINCSYKVLYVSNGHSSNDYPQYDAPCHLKFGPSYQSMKHISNNTNSSISDYEDEIDSISVTHNSNEYSPSSDELDVEDDFKSLSVTETKSIPEVNLDVATRSSARLEKLTPENSMSVPLEKRGFGRGAFFRKLSSSRT